jgi:dTDP-4-amino-4,6-dideoxygalactose transaminase
MIVSYQKYNNKQTVLLIISFATATVRKYQIMSFEKIVEFESALAKFTGAPYAVMTDCCTHAIELCLRYDNINVCYFQHILISAYQ